MKIKQIIIGVVIGLAIMFTLKECNTEIIEVPVRVEVEVPVVVKEFDTIYEPVPVPYTVVELDTTLVEEYKKANDSLKQEIFNSAVTVREYKEIFEDSIQTITVGANVTGTLNSLSVGYETKPRTIVIDTVIPVKVPTKPFTIYGEVGVPTNLLYPQVVFKAGADYKINKTFVVGGSYDTQGRVWGKIGIKF